MPCRGARIHGTRIKKSRPLRNGSEKRYGSTASKVYTFYHTFKENAMEDFVTVAVHEEYAKRMEEE